MKIIALICWQIKRTNVNNVTKAKTNELYGAKEQNQLKFQSCSKYEVKSGINCFASN